MKKIFTLAILLQAAAISLPGFGQIKLGLKAGISANNTGYQVENPSPGVDVEESEKRNREAFRWKTGYTIGLAAEYGLTNALSIQSGLELSRKGYRIKLDKTESTDTYTSTRSARGFSAVSYLEIPVNLAYKFKAFQIHAGPYLGVGLAGKGKIEQKYSATSPWESIQSQTTWEDNYVFRTRIKESDNPQARYRQEFVQRLDAGLNLGVGYLIGPVLVSATYTQGLRNLQPPLPSQEDESPQAIYHNQRIGLAATWYFRNF